MKYRIVTYKVLAKGMPSEDEGKLNVLCANMNRNEIEEDVIYKVESVEG